MKLPTYWQHADLPGFNGIVWFRKEINLPDDWNGKTAALHLDTIDDQDTTWVNGVKVGAMNNFGDVRNYVVPAGVLKPGRNVVIIRVLDTGGLGGVYGKAERMKLELPGNAGVAPIDLSGDWQYQATTLYNAMIAPLQPSPIKGVIWYQGESNDNTDQRARQYRTLFPLLIKDWRQNWGLGNFPFLFVQIAPYSQMTPAIRESQLLTFESVPRTGMAVITDAGDANNIHPANKQIVGERLALAARAVAYGEKIEAAGPVFQSLKIKGDKAVLRFSHLGGGLVAKDGPLKGFTIAGDDKKFVPAQATISGKTVVVTSDQVARPVAVRYGWSNVPDVNLYNQAGLPASPFRTDVD
jgi:sialate O-acetylesterase